MPDTTSTQRIVPDVDQSLTAQHLRHRRGPRLWPIWLFLLLLVAALAGAAWMLWQERERLLNEVHRVSGEASNLHARIDSGDGDMEDDMAVVKAQMATLFQEQEQLASRVTDTREELYGLLTDSQDSEAVNSLDQQLSRLEEQATLRDQQLSAFASSLDALEESGTAGRQNLVEEVNHLDQLIQQRLAAFSSQLSSETSRHEAWQEAVQANIEELSAAVASLENDDQGEVQASLDTLEQRLAALESDLRQVRQAQLAFSAQMEMLR